MWAANLSPRYIGIFSRGPPASLSPSAPFWSGLSPPRRPQGHDVSLFFFQIKASFRLMCCVDSLNCVLFCSRVVGCSGYFLMSRSVVVGLFGDIASLAQVLSPAVFSRLSGQAVFSCWCYRLARQLPRLSTSKAVHITGHYTLLVVLHTHVENRCADRHVRIGWSCEKRLE